MTQEQVLDLFEYREGKLYWKVNKARRIKAGDLAGTLNPNGYRQVFIDNRSEREHRIIFLMHHGYLPEFVDHIDRNRSNNNIENLREATKSQNSINKKLMSNNTSGYKGVFWSKWAKKWRARVTVRGKNIYLGCFDTPELAYDAYKKAALIHYGKFSNV